MSKKRHIDLLMEAQAAPLSKYWEKDLPTYSNPAADIISWRGDGEVPTIMKSKDLDSVVDLILDDGKKNVKKPKTIGSSMKNVAERSSQDIMDRADLLAEEHFGIGYSSLEQFDAGFDDIASILEVADTAQGPAFKQKTQQLQDDIDKEEGTKDMLGKKTKTVKEDAILDESAYNFDFSDDDMDHDVDYNVKLSESAPIQHLEESEDEDLDGITSLIREMNELENEIEEAVKNDDYDDESDDDEDDEEDDEDEEDKKKKKKDDTDADGEDDEDDDADDDGGLSEGFEIDFDEDIFED